jgi:hypothetical protein
MAQFRIDQSMFILIDEHAEPLIKVILKGNIGSRIFPIRSNGISIKTGSGSIFVTGFVSEINEGILFQTISKKP